MDVLEAYDLTRSCRSAALLCDLDHHAERRYVPARAAGIDPTRLSSPERRVLTDAPADKITEWIDRSQGRVRADVVHEKLCALGYKGFERTTRRVVAALKRTWRRENARAYRPWLSKPGL